MGNSGLTGSKDDIGLLIKILDGRQYRKYRSGWTERMDNLVGKTYEIVNYYVEHDAYLISDENDNTWLIDCDKCTLIDKDEEEIKPCGDIMMIL